MAYGKDEKELMAAGDQSVEQVIDEGVTPVEHPIQSPVQEADVEEEQRNEERLEELKVTTTEGGVEASEPVEGDGERADQ